ncbi:enkurin-like [Stegodyphus dumicola]|uniref:enkurin-like n=1 Tax=Stegodyphus dumicola TaxID=202533 RepID=UPI0015ACA8C7|nr:enkurin-like [Stegodyphus dumicola]
MTSFQRIVIPKSFKEFQVPSESIYNLASGSVEIQKRPPRYHSKYTSSTKKFYESVKKPHQTMGNAKTPLAKPKEYLKKHSRDTSKPEIKPLTLEKEHKKPPVPKSDDPPPMMHEKVQKNFIKMNILNVMRKPALKPARKIVDTKRGDCFLIELSGLVPKYCMKKEFGETPGYLVKRRKDIEYSNEMLQKSSEEEQLRKLSEEEKDTLIEGLRANWEELNKRYLSLPLAIDTNVLKSRKLDLEKKLDLLEHDIYFLEKNKDIDIFVVPH